MTATKLRLVVLVVMAGVAGYFAIAGHAGSSVSAGDSVVVTTISVRPTRTDYIVMTGPQASINAERARMQNAVAAGVLPTGESVSIVDGDQHRGRFLCTKAHADVTAVLYSTDTAAASC